MAWLSKYSPVPRFPDYTGPYSVGSIDLEIPVAEISGISAASKPEDAPSTCSARLFYPCQKPQASGRPIYWIQKPQRSIISAFASFLGASHGFSEFVSYCPNVFNYIKIPAHKNATLLPPETTNKRWPVMVFSHGLGGSRNTYSYICACLASYGIVVVAPEHRDGSSPISHIHAYDPTQNKAVHYQHISHTPSEEVFTARDRQLRIRLWELNVAYEALMMIANGQSIANPTSYITKNIAKSTPIKEVLTGMADKLDVYDAGSISWAGHSFGGATTIQLIKSVFYSSTTSTRIYKSDPASSLAKQINQISPVILLDPWGLPLDSPATRDLFRLPMPCFAPGVVDDNRPDESPLLAVLSGAFVDWKVNFKTIKKALTDTNRSPFKSNQRPPAHIFYPKISAHLAQSDFGMLFPTLSKYVAKSEDCERTMQLNVRAALEVLRRRDVQVAPANVSEEVMEDSEEAKLDPDGQEGDWRILDRREGAIKDWLRVELYQVDQTPISALSTPSESSSSTSTPIEEKHDKMAKTLPATKRPSLKNFTSTSASSIKAVTSSLRSKAISIGRSTSYSHSKEQTLGHGGGHRKILTGAAVGSGTANVF